MPKKYKVSIIDNGVKRCYLCGSTNSIETHHIFSNCNRKKSTEYGLVVNLCAECHRGVNGVHNNYEKMRYLREIGQKAFTDHYPELDFISIFHRNYL